jgi:hypothetical protein
VTSFIQQQASRVWGVLSGFDRVRFRGTVRLLASVGGLTSFLAYRRILFKDFGVFVQDVRDRVQASVERVAAAAGKTPVFVASPAIDKEQLVRKIMAEEGVADNGLAAVLKATEVCQGFDLFRNRETKHLDLVARTRKCLHYYVYWQDRRLGLTQVRIQTWLPLNVHIVLNGREWLSRQLTQANIPFQRRDNCLPWVADFERAQALLDRQVASQWPKLLDRLLHRACPALSELWPDFPLDRYWSAEQTEWATDVSFRDGRELAELYPRLLNRALTELGSRDVMRFLGKLAANEKHSFERFQGEVVTGLVRRPEGVRIKHAVGGNSVKMYDKQGSVLRIETTINDPRDMKVFRRPQGQPQAKPRWLKLRKGVADLRRRAHISQRANERYLDRLATPETAAPLKTLVDPLTQPVFHNGRRYRGLNILAGKDSELLAAAAAGEGLLNGFRNRDIAATLFGPPATDPQQARRRTTKVSRLLALLRAHGLISKVQHTHRWQLTPHGQTLVALTTAARCATSQKLLAV